MGITDGTETCALCGEWSTGCDLCGQAPMVNHIRQIAAQERDEKLWNEELRQQEKSIRQAAEKRNML